MIKFTKRYILPYPYNPAAAQRIRIFLNAAAHDQGDTALPQTVTYFFTPEELANLTRVFMENEENKYSNQLQARAIISSYTDRLNSLSTNLLPEVNILRKIVTKQSRLAIQHEVQPLTQLPKVDDIYNLVISKDMLLFGYSRIKSNVGSTTGGVTGESGDNFSLRRIEKLHHKLKTNTFTWRPLDRTLIEKPGTLDPKTNKPKLRPIDVPEFEDRVLQASILTVLEAIYEPWFEVRNVSFGFRPYKSLHDALEQLKLQGQGSNFAVEGDITGAFNNVQPDVFIQIMSKRIKGRKFLNLIRNAFKCGIHLDGLTTYTDLGTPRVELPALSSLTFTSMSLMILSNSPSLQT